MQNKFWDVINELNLSFGKAIITLKKAGLIAGDDYYTHDTILSEEQYDILLNLSLKRKKNLERNKSRGLNNESIKKTNTINDSSLAQEKHMLSAFSFSSNEIICNRIKTQILFDKIKEDIRILQNENVNLLSLPLFNSMIINKGIVVTRKYYYYTSSFRKKLVTTECLATLIACKLSEAVNNNIISWNTYYEIYKKHLHKYIKLIKSPPKKKRKKKKIWYSVVSVPFGGMNKR